MNKYNKNYQFGFTILELIVAVALAGILTAAALLNVSELRVTFNKSDAQNQVREQLRVAQFQSVAEGGRGVFVIAADGKSYLFGYDYLPYDTTNPIAPDVNSMKWKYNMPQYTKIASTEQIIFNSQGNVTDKDGILISPTLTFSETSTGSDVQYSIAKLSATGVLTFN